MNRGAALTGALLTTLARPASWPLAFGAFLLRGGIVLFVVPIVVLPSPVGLGNALGPTLTAIALGSVTGPAIVAGAALAIVVIAALVGAGWLAAALEAEAVRIVAGDEAVAALRPRPSRATGGRVAGRILLARSAAAIPFLIVLAWGSVRLVAVTYGELTSPLDVTTPIVLRVLRATPDVIVAVVLTWMVAEIVGAIAARRIVLGGERAWPAVRGAVATSLRHPLTTLGRFWLPTVVLVVVICLMAVAASLTWGGSGDALEATGDPIAALPSVVGLVLAWIVGSLSTSVVCAWRAAVWTVAEAIREGTFGGSSDTQPGDWRHDPGSATL